MAQLPFNSPFWADICRLPLRISIRNYKALNTSRHRYDKIQHRPTTCMIAREDITTRFHQYQPKNFEEVHRSLILEAARHMILQTASTGNVGEHKYGAILRSKSSSAKTEGNH